MNEDKKRENWIDLAKGIGILCVLVGHSGPRNNAWMIWLVNVIYAFHMPLFFFLSGYVFSVKKDWKNFLVGKIRSLVIPYYVLGAINLAFVTLMKHPTISKQDFSFIAALKQYILQDRFGVLWYICVLFCIEIMMYWLIKWCENSNRRLIMSMCVIGLIGILYNAFIGKELYFSLDILPMAVPFFGGGYLCKNSNKNGIFVKTKFTRVIIDGIIALLFSIINIYCFIHSHVDMYFGKYGNYLLFYVSAFLYIFVIVWLCQNIYQKFPGVKAVEFIGRNSMLYYALHMWVSFVICGDILEKLCLFQGCSLIDNVMRSGIMVISSLCVWTIVTVVISKWKYCWIFGVKHNLLSDNKKD